MKKMEEKKVVVQRVQLSGADAEKAAFLMEHYFLDMKEMVKLLIRKEYNNLIQEKSKTAL